MRMFLHGQSFVGGRKSEYVFWLGVLFLCTVVLCIPYFSSQVLVGDDTIVHLNRIEGIKEGLLSGQFPVRIHAFQMNGFGFPAGIFYPDLFLYIPALFRLCGMPLNIAYNLFSILIQIVTMILSCYAFWRITRSLRLSVLSTVLYMAFWYRLMDFYFRGALGEMIALAFFPLLFAGLFCVLRDEYDYWPLLAAAYTGMLQSHIISTLFAIAITFAACGLWLTALREQKRRQALLKSIGITVLLNIWFIVPFLMFYHNMDFNVKVPSGALQCMWFSDLFIMQFCTGFAILLACGMFWYKRRSCRSFLTEGLYKGIIRLFILGIVCIVLNVCTPVWRMIEAIPMVGKSIDCIQFPWRLMEFASVGLSLCGAAGIIAFWQRETARKWIALFCIATSLIGVASVFYVPLTYRGLQFYTLEKRVFSGQGLESYGPAVGNDYLYKGLVFEKMKDREGNVPNQMDLYTTAKISSMKKQGTSLNFEYSSGENAQAVLPLFYYPGYKAVDDTGCELPVTEYSEDHLLALAFPAGSRSVRLWYDGLPVFKVFDWISLLGWAYVLFMMLRRCVKRRIA